MLPPRICAGVAPPYAVALRAASMEMLPPAEGGGSEGGGSG